jgi:hypothetical protein
MKPAHLCFTLVCLAQIFAIMTPREAKAWGPEGNRVVARIADRLLQAHDPRVQKKVAAILATDKDNSWTAISVYRIDSAYQDRAIAAVREQLAKAGVRLAFLLRENIR